MLIGWGLLSYRPRLGKFLIVLGPLALALLSLPVVANWMIGRLQPYPALSLNALPAADAIVVLCGGVNEYGMEYGGVTVNRISLERARYAAYLQQHSGLPILVTGGSPGRPGAISEAAAMAQVLRQDFKVPVRWTEEHSYNTAENAAFSAKLLKQDRRQRILLVTTAWHMPRAVASFQQTGLTVLAAPTAFTYPSKYQLATDFVPSAAALATSFYALHETIGLLWYRLRGAA